MRTIIIQKEVLSYIRETIGVALAVYVPIDKIVHRCNWERDMGVTANDVRKWAIKEGVVMNHNTLELNWEIKKKLENEIDEWLFKKRYINKKEMIKQKVIETVRISPKVKRRRKA